MGTRKYTILWEHDGMIRKTEWYARSKENAQALFEMWHKGVSVISVV